MALLANSFKDLFEAKKEGSLKEWIEKAKSYDSGLKNFVKGIEADFEAVNQAVISTISNGQVEKNHQTTNVWKGWIYSL